VSERRFSVTLPDWGQDHLSSEAIAAFVDNELADGPHSRATRHLAVCPECAAQIVAQDQTSSALRSAECPALPSSLMNSLRSIPQEADLPGPPAGLAVSADGQLVSVLRPERLPAPDDVPIAEVPAADRAADAPAGGASLVEIQRATSPVRISVTSRPVGPSRTDHGRRPTGRRVRFGATAAMSGLALGALALGVGAASGPPAPAAPADRGVFNGSVLGGGGSVVDAQLRITPTSSGGALNSRMVRVVPGSFLRLP
jgi:hypothetical protein